MRPAPPSQSTGAADRPATPGSARRARWIALGVAVVGVATLAIVRPWGPRRAGVAGEAAAPSLAAGTAPVAPAVVVPPLPKFERPEEAKRYRQAVIAGDERSVALVDRALAEIRRQPNGDAQQIEKLRRLRAERQARLEAYRKATP